jgi:hypothetical protein
MTLDDIRAAFDALAECDDDPIGTFCGGYLPGDLPHAAALVLSELTYVRGQHPGVSEDSPEVLVESPLGPLVVGYDDHEGGRGMAAEYRPDLDVIA